MVKPVKHYGERSKAHYKIVLKVGKNDQNKFTATLTHSKK